MSSDPDRAVEHRLRAAVESAPSGLLMVDPRGQIVLVNREIERLFGYSREELLGRSVDMLVPPESRGGHGDDRAAFLSDPRTRAMGVGRDLYGIRKDGRRVPLEIGLTPVASEDGLYVLSAIVDISARKRADARFRAAVDSSPAGMAMVDEEGRILLVNREVERMFGYDREELLGKSIDRLVPERFRGAHPGFRGGFHGAPGARPMGAGRDLFGLRKDGSEIPVEIGLTPIDTEEGILILSSIVDISARKEEERVRQELEAQLRHAQKMEAVGTLAGGIAHDFNNILAGIVSYSELLRARLPDAEDQADMDEVLQYCRRGKELVQRILAFSRRREPSRVPVNIPDTLQEVTRLLRSSLPPDLRIEVQVAQGTPPALADPAALRQVLMNLGINAAHAMPGGGRVSFGAEPLYVADRVARQHPRLKEGPHVVLTVVDHGTGMDEQTLARALEPFFTTKDPGQGSGLGLAIVHTVVEDHHGSLELESRPGVGTTVRCVFPAAGGAAAPVSETLSGRVRGAGQRILCVDDEPALARVRARGLQALGYIAVEESSSTAALERLRQDPGAFEAVVTDYLMPGLNGLELAAGIHRLRPDLPVVLMTGFIDELSEEAIRKADLVAVLRKPVTLEELGEALGDLFEERGAE